MHSSVTGSLRQVEIQFILLMRLLSTQCEFLCLSKLFFLLKGLAGVCLHCREQSLVFFNLIGHIMSVVIF
jgi:hypothetical protein